MRLPSRPGRGVSRPAAEPPPRLSPVEAARLGLAPADPSFLTGNGLAARCRHVLNYAGLELHDEADEDWWFCKLDSLEWLLSHAGPRRRFVLVTHNSDYPVDRRYELVLRRRHLRAWFAANAALRHPKLVSLPLGIANPGWGHGSADALRAAQAASARKTTLVDVSFSLETNPDERRRCLEQTRLELAPRLPHAEYLARLASAYFCLSPQGHGIDAHRTWEALYLRTVPIVRRSPLTEEYSELPWIVLDDWAELRSVGLSPQLYEDVMGDWDPSTLTVDALVARMRRRLDEIA